MSAWWYTINILFLGFSSIYSTFLFRAQRSSLFNRNFWTSHPQNIIIIWCKYHQCKYHTDTLQKQMIMPSLTAHHLFAETMTSAAAVWYENVILTKCVILWNVLHWLSYNSTRVYKWIEIVVSRGKILIRMV